MNKVMLSLAALLFAGGVQAADAPWADKEAADTIAALIKPLPKLEVKSVDVPLGDVAKNLGMISWMAVNPKADEIYLLQRGKNADPVVVVDHTGKVLRSWGAGLYKTPHSIRIDADGNVWTVDSMSSMVLKYAPDGKKLLEISVGEQPQPDKTSGTADIAFSPGGHVFIADGYGNARILEYSKDGKRLGQWGTHGTGPGQFDTPHSIVIDKDNVVYVADRENGRIQRFTLAGKFLGEWTGFGKPMNLKLADDNTLLVAVGYHNPPKVTPAWIAWVIKVDKKTGKPLAYLDVGDDAHAMEVLGNGEIITGGDTGPVSAVHQFKAAH